MRLLVRGQTRSGTTFTSHLLTYPDHMRVTSEYGIYDYIFNPKLKPTNEQVRNHIVNKVFTSRTEIEDREEVVRRLQGISRKYPMTKKEVIEHIEWCLFQDVPIFGDKMPCGATLHKMQSLFDMGFKFKIIYLIRDGRDVLASRIFRSPYRERDQSVEELTRHFSMKWAARIKYWQAFQRKFPDIPAFTLRFEDFRDRPHELLPELADFTAAPLSILRQSFAQKFREGSITSKWEDKLPEWESDFHPHALDMLEELGYSAG